MKVILDGVAQGKHNEIESLINHVFIMLDNNNLLYTKDIEIVISKDHHKYINELCMKYHGYPYTNFGGVSLGKAIPIGGKIIVSLNNINFSNGTEQIDIGLKNKQIILLFHELMHAQIIYINKNIAYDEVFFSIWDEYYTTKETTKYLGIMKEETTNYFDSLIALLKQVNDVINEISNDKLSEEYRGNIFYAYIKYISYYLGSILGVIDGLYYLDKDISNNIKNALDKYLSTNNIKINYNGVWGKLKSIPIIPSINDINELEISLKNMIRDGANLY